MTLPVGTGASSVARLAVASLALTQAAAGCATGNDHITPAALPAQQSSSVIAAQSLPGAVAIYRDDVRDYVIRSSSLELFAIRSAEIALRRSDNSRVKSLALDALRNHNGLSAQLSYAGRRLNILPAATLLPQHEHMLLQLINSSDVGATYVLQQRAACISAYQLHSAYLRNGRSPTLRAVAQRAVTVVTSEFERLRRF